MMMMKQTSAFTFICRWEKVIVTENNKSRIFYLDCSFFPMFSSIMRGKPPIITLKQAFKSECNFQLFYLNSEKLILPSLFLSTVLIISSTFILNRFSEKLSKNFPPTSFSETPPGRLQRTNLTIIIIIYLNPNPSPKSPKASSKLIKSEFEPGLFSGLVGHHWIPHLDPNILRAQMNSEVQGLTL